MIRKIKEYLYNKKMNDKKIIVKAKVNTKSKESFLLSYLKDMPATWNEDGTKQCKRDAGRTFDDLYRIVKTKFTTTTKQEVARMLINFSIGNKCKALRCGTARQVTFHSYKSPLFQEAKYCFNKDCTYSNWKMEAEERFPFPKSGMDIIKLAKY